MELPYDPVCPSVGYVDGQSVGQSDYHNFIKGREVSLPCSYRSTCSSEYWFVFKKKKKIQPMWGTGIPCVSFNLVDAKNLQFSYRVFVKYCVFSEDFKNIPDSGLSLFSLGVSVCTHTRQAEHQCCSRSGRVQKNPNILMKKHNI